MRAILIGASGLTGGLLLEKLLQDPVFSKVKLIGRRPLGEQHSKLEEAVINFEDDTAFSRAVADADALFCCVGTTQKKVKGDQDAYRKIDFDIPVKAARFCAQQNIPKYLLVSSVGANASSGSFYLRLKGETEAAVLSQNIPTVYIMRPSMLLGNHPETRWGEIIGQPLTQFFSLFFFGALSKYKAIHANDVAQAMLVAAKQTGTGKFVLEYNAMKKMIGA